MITLPYFSGERSPINDLEAKGVFFGMSLSHSRADLYRSCLEGIAYGLRHNIEVMGEADAAPERLIAIGGGAQDALWPQICSDVTGLPQDLPQQTIGAAYGDAYIAGMAAGIFEDWKPLRERWAEDRAPHSAGSGGEGDLRRALSDLPRSLSRHKTAHGAAFTA